MKKHLDIIMCAFAIILLTCFIIGTMGSNGDCGNAKVVRGKDTIHINQDSIDEAYWHHKADSMVEAIKHKHDKETQE